MNIWVTNESTVLTPLQVSNAMGGFSHFGALVASAWGLKVPTFTVGTPPVESWQIVILDNSDQAGALGYHDFTPGGKPIAKVFAKTDQDNGYNWQVTLTHELGEMIVDPWITDAMEVGARFYAKEIGDPVEADKLGFSFTDPGGNVTTLSDFIYPNWFIPGDPGPYDFKHHCSAPLQVLAGGYAQYFSSNQWHQVNSQKQEVTMDPADLSMRIRLRGR